MKMQFVQKASIVFGLMVLVVSCGSSSKGGHTGPVEKSPRDDQPQAPQDDNGDDSDVKALAVCPTDPTLVADEDGRNCDAACVINLNDENFYGDVRPNDRKLKDFRDSDGVSVKVTGEQCKSARFRGYMKDTTRVQVSGVPQLLFDNAFTTRGLLTIHGASVDQPTKIVVRGLTPFSAGDAVDLKDVEISGEAGTLLGQTDKLVKLTLDGIKVVGGKTGLTLVAPQDRDSVMKRENGGFYSFSNVTVTDSSHPLSLNFPDPLEAFMLERGSAVMDPSVSLSLAYAGSKGTLSAKYTYLVNAFDIVGGGSLTIEKGAVIKLTAGAEIRVNGSTLTAQGTADEPIIFTSFRDASVGGNTNGDGETNKAEMLDWQAVLVTNNGDTRANARLTNVDVRYAGIGVAASDVRLEAVKIGGTVPTDGNWAEYGDGMLGADRTETALFVYYGAKVWIGGGSSIADVPQNAITADVHVARGDATELSTDGHLTFGLVGGKKVSCVQSENYRIKLTGIACD